MRDSFTKYEEIKVPKHCHCFSCDVLKYRIFPRTLSCMGSVIDPMCIRQWKYDFHLSLLKCFTFMASSLTSPLTFSSGLLNSPHRCTCFHHHSIHYPSNIVIVKRIQPRSVEPNTTGERNIEQFCLSNTTLMLTCDY